MPLTSYAALYASVQASLRTTDDYGRDGRHAFASCPACRIIVCTSHHNCPRGAS